MRIIAHPALRVRDADGLEQFDRPCLRLFAARDAVDRQRLSIWLPIVNTGLSAVIGSWKTRAISAPRTLCIARSSSDSRSRPLNRSAAGNPPGVLHEAQNRQRRHRLAASGLAHQAQRLTRIDVKADVDDRRRGSARQMEHRGQILD